MTNREWQSYLDIDSFPVPFSSPYPWGLSVYTGYKSLLKAELRRSSIPELLRTLANNFSEMQPVLSQPCLCEYTFIHVSLSKIYQGIILPRWVWVVHKLTSVTGAMSVVNWQFFFYASHTDTKHERTENFLECNCTKVFEDNDFHWEFSLWERNMNTSRAILYGLNLHEGRYFSRH